MTNKRDHSPPPSTSEQNKKHDVHQSDVNISHSSWLYKLTSMPNTSTTKLDSNNEKDPQSDEKGDTNEKNEETTAENIPKQTKEDENEPSLANGENGGGIWSWLGYSGIQSATTTSVPEAAPVSESAPAPVPTNDLNKVNQESTTSDHKDSDNVTLQETNLQQHSHNKSTASTKQSYWKSFFTSNKNSEDINNQQDSVIISDKDDPTEQYIPATSTTITEELIPEEPQRRKLPVAPSRHNVVLPTFKSQFNKLTVPYHHESASIFSKAINAINSIIFAQKSAIDDDWQDINQLSTMLESLKTDVSNKRIVIIGVHGWFPMKVCMNTFDLTQNSCMFIFFFCLSSLFEVWWENQQEHLSNFVSK